MWFLSQVHSGTKLYKLYVGNRELYTKKVFVGDLINSMPILNGFNTNTFARTTHLVVSGNIRLALLQQVSCHQTNMVSYKLACAFFCVTGCLRLYWRSNFCLVPYSSLGCIRALLHTAIKTHLFQTERKPLSFHFLFRPGLANACRACQTWKMCLCIFFLNLVTFHFMWQCPSFSNFEDKMTV